MAEGNPTRTKTGKIGNWRRKIGNAALQERVAAGRTAAQIAAEFGVSRQAVSLRAIRLGLADQLHANLLGQRPPKPPTKRSVKYGMADAEIEPLIKCGATAAFTRQRENSKKRGIAFQFTFADWWQIWDESGRWAERGVGDGKYVMARYGDVGPYSVGNVYICTQNQNASDTWKNKPDRPNPGLKARGAGGKFLPTPY